LSSLSIQQKIDILKSDAYYKRTKTYADGTPAYDALVEIKLGVKEPTDTRDPIEPEFITVQGKYGPYVRESSKRMGLEISESMAEGIRIENRKYLQPILGSIDAYEKSLQTYSLLRDRKRGVWRRNVINREAAQRRRNGSEEDIFVLKDSFRFAFTVRKLEQALAIRPHTVLAPIKALIFNCRQNTQLLYDLAIDLEPCIVELTSFFMRRANDRSFVA
jgi:hypothetical protein